MSTFCVHNIKWEYYDCKRNANTTEKLMARYTPRHECDFNALESITMRTNRLLLLNIYLYHLPSRGSPGDPTDGDMTARRYCIATQGITCIERRIELILCPQKFPMNMTEVLYQIYGLPGEKFAKLYCKLEPETFTVRLLKDINDISQYYNKSSRPVFIKLFLQSAHQLLNSDLTTYNLSKCDAKTLMFRQSGCLYKTMALFDIDLYLEPDYVVDYLRKSMKTYNSCWGVYQDACRVESERLSYVGDALNGLAEYYSLKSITCPFEILLMNIDALFSAYINLDLLVTAFRSVNILKLLIMYTNKDITQIEALIKVKKLSQVFQYARYDTFTDYTMLYENLCGKDIAMTVKKQVLQIVSSYDTYRQVYDELMEHLEEIITVN